MKFDAKIATFVIFEEWAAIYVDAKLVHYGQDLCTEGSAGFIKKLGIEVEYASGDEEWMETRSFPSEQLPFDPMAPSAKRLELLKSHFASIAPFPEALKDVEFDEESNIPDALSMQFEHDDPKLVTTKVIEIGCKNPNIASEPRAILSFPGIRVEIPLTVFHHVKESIDFNLALEIIEDKMWAVQRGSDIENFGPRPLWTSNSIVREEEDGS